MRLFCYKAKCGDAFHLQYEGESGRCRNIFLDMGYSKTYTQVLKSVISNLIETSEQIDALFLSHIHDDHIGGASRFIKDIQKGCIWGNVVCRWIYNPPRKYEVEQASDNKNGVLCGIVTGDKIYEYIHSHSPLDMCDVIEGMSFSIDGMTVTILSPDEGKLNLLRDKYSNNRPLCKSETDEVSVEAGNVVDDYSTLLNDFNAECFQEDMSIENASSIAALFECAGKRILSRSDSVTSVIMHSLYKLGYSETNKLRCDAVLLSHHGSVANNSLALFKMIRCEKYIISADGINRHCLPNKETIGRIISASSKLPIKLYFNYNNGRLLRMFKADATNYVKSIIDIHYLHDMEAIDL